MSDEPKAIQKPSDSSEDHYDYVPTDPALEGYSVWFKFGCAHVSSASGDYIHLCEPKAFAEWLLAAIELSKEKGNTHEQ